MTDYYSVIIKAIETLDNNNGQARSEVYARARNALIGRLRAIDPPLNEADITRQRLTLERAIRRVENEIFGSNQSQSASSTVQTPEPLQQTDLADKPKTVKLDLPEFNLNKGDETNKETAAPRIPDLDSSTAFQSKPIIKTAPEKPQPKDPISPNLSPASLKPSTLNVPPYKEQNEPPIKVKTRANRRNQGASLYGVMNKLLMPVIGVLLILIAVMVFQYRNAIREVFGVEEASQTEALGDATPEKVTPEIVAPNEEKPQIEDILNGNNSQDTAEPQSETKVDKADNEEALEEIQNNIDVVDLLNNLPPQQAAYFEDVKGDVGTKKIDGSVSWRLAHATERDVAPYQIEADINLKQAGIHGKIMINQSLDETTALTHTIRVTLETSQDAENGGIKEITGLLAKRELNGDGEVFDALQRQISVPSRDNAPARDALLLGLSASDQGRVHNSDLLRSFESLDILLILENGRKAIIAIERGDSGSKVVNTALNYWR